MPRAFPMARFAFLLTTGACAPLATRALSPAPCSAAADASCANVGYGMSPSRYVTGAVSSYIVQPNDLSSIGRIEQLIEGRLSGVYVIRDNGDYSLRVRHYTGEPLIVIDGIPASPGMPASRMLMGLAPASVLRIDVLKDIGATSVYGMRGANGVILITTRR